MDSIHNMILNLEELRLLHIEDRHHAKTAELEELLGRRVELLSRAIVALEAHEATHGLRAVTSCLGGWETGPQAPGTEPQPIPMPGGGYRME